MKLLYLQNVRMPTEKAHGIQIMKMSESFALSEIDVELVVPKRFNKIKKDPFEYYGITKQFKIKKLPCLDLIPLDKFLGHVGLWVESLTFLFFVFWYILFKKTDIIYSRDRFLLPLTLLKKNFVFEAHTFPKNYSLYALLFKKLKKLVVITKNLKTSFIERGIASEKILVAPDGVDVSQFNIKETKEECRNKLSLPLDKKIVLYTGHLYGWKGGDILLEAANFLQNCQLVFVGGTEQHIAKFKKQAVNLDNVWMVGHKSYKEIPYWLKAADVLVLPNSGKADISIHWTSPLKMFEYMSSKRPIVASSLPAIKEILNKNNSVLVEPNNPKELASAISMVLENNELAQAISDRAFEDVKQYSWKKRVDNIISFI